MSRNTLSIASYADCIAVFDTARNKHEGKPLGENTRLMQGWDGRSVTYAIDDDMREAIDEKYAHEPGDNCYIHCSSVERAIEESGAFSEMSHLTLYGVGRKISALYEIGRAHV
jgi:hypothetical protein